VILQAFPVRHARARCGRWGGYDEFPAIAFIVCARALGRETIISLTPPAEPPHPADATSSAQVAAGWRRGLVRPMRARRHTARLGHPSSRMA